MAGKSLESRPTVEATAPRRPTLREQAGSTIKVFLLTGGLLGGLWLLQTIAKY